MPISRIEGVLCCGNTVFDIAAWPVSDCTWSTTTWVEAISEGIGGNGANTSFALARLGVPVKLFSIVGSDERGDRLLQFLGQAGVDTSRMARSQSLSTPCTVILVNKEGDRKFLHRPGASAELSASVVDVPPSGFSHFHLANPFALPVLRTEAAELMKRVKAAGLTTSVDTGWDSKGRWITDLAGCLPHTDILMVNDAEAKMLGSNDDLHAAVAAIRDRGVTDVIVKTGARGCSLYSPDATRDVPAFAVNALDSTGAGDSFAGGFLAGLHRGWPYEECARLGNAAGALTVQHLGGSTGMCSFEEMVHWMSTQRTSA